VRRAFDAPSSARYACDLLNSIVPYSLTLDASKCEWLSIKPGSRVMSPKSITLAPTGMVSPRPNCHDPLAFNEHHGVTNQLTSLHVQQPRRTDGGLDRLLKSFRRLFLRKRWLGQNQPCEEGDQPLKHVIKMSVTNENVVGSGHGGVLLEFKSGRSTQENDKEN